MLQRDGKPSTVGVKCHSSRKHPCQGVSWHSTAGKFGKVGFAYVDLYLPGLVGAEDVLPTEGVDVHRPIAQFACFNQRLGVAVAIVGLQGQVVAFGGDIVGWVAQCGTVATGAAGGTECHRVGIDAVGVAADALGAQQVAAVGRQGHEDGLVAHHRNAGPQRAGCRTVDEGVFQHHGVTLAHPACKGGEAVYLAHPQLHGPQAVALAVVLIAAHVGGGAVGAQLAAEVVGTCGSGGTHVDAG